MKNAPNHFNMPSEARLSDLDRRRAGELLRRHQADGRLTPEETEVRRHQVVTSRTFGDLDPIFEDLPLDNDDPGSPAGRHIGTPLPSSGGITAPQLVASIAWQYLVVAVPLIIVWAVTGAGTFWPIWPMIAWAVYLIWQTSRNRGMAQAWRDSRSSTDKQTRAVDDPKE